MTRKLQHKNCLYHPHTQSFHVSYLFAQTFSPTFTLQGSTSSTITNVNTAQFYNLKFKPSLTFRSFHFVFVMVC